MNGKDLLMGLSFVDEAYIQDSEEKRRPLAWKRWASMAACLCLILVGVLLWPGIAAESEHSLNDSIPQSGNVSPAPELTTEPPAEENVQADMETAELPTVIVRIDAMTEEGFTATVVELVDTEVYPVGTELSVRLKPEGELQNLELKDTTVAYDTGDVVYLMFTPEDLEQGVVYADQIWAYEEEG